MSTADIERFIADLKDDENLQNGIKALNGGVVPLVAFANEQGYDFTDAEAHAYVKAQTGAELTDEQLNAISGGKAVVSSTEVVTSTVAVSTSGVTLVTEVVVTNELVMGSATVAATSNYVGTSTSVSVT